MNCFKAFRLYLGLTQKALAEQLGLAPSCVCAWERDQRRPTLRSLETMAKLFNFTIDEILSFKISPEQKNISQNRNEVHL